MEIKEAAATLQVTLQTVRNWLKIGDQYFTETATRKHGKRFTPSDMQQLQRIKELLAEGLKYQQIPEHLSPAPQIVEEYYEDPQPEPPEQHQEAKTDIQPVEMFEQFRRLLEQQRENHQETITAKNETIEVLKDEIKRLGEDLERARLPWWRRR